MRTLQLSALALLTWSPTALAATGTLNISAPEAPGEIVLDGFPTGEMAPAVLTDLPAGEHEIELRHGCLRAVQNVKVKGGGTVDVVLRMKPDNGNGSLRLRGLPQGATATVDGEELSRTEGAEVACGDHTVVVRAPGFVAFKSALTITKGQRATIDVDMQRGDMADGAVAATRARGEFDDWDEDDDDWAMTPTPSAAGEAPVFEDDADDFLAPAPPPKAVAPVTQRAPPRAPAPATAREPAPAPRASAAREDLDAPEDNKKVARTRPPPPADRPSSRDQASRSKPPPPKDRPTPKQQRSRDGDVPNSVLYAAIGSGVVGVGAGVWGAVELSKFSTSKDTWAYAATTFGQASPQAQTVYADVKSHRNRAVIALTLSGVGLATGVGLGTWWWVSADGDGASMAMGGTF